MRGKWTRAGLVLLTLVVVFATLYGVSYLLIRNGNRSEFLGQVATGIACLVAYLAAVRLIERRAVSEFAMGGALPEFATGLIGGLALFSLAMAILWAAGVYRPQGLNGFAGIGTGFLFWLAVGVREEILYRGAVFRFFTTLLGTWGALVVNAVVFGAMHTGNPGWTGIGLVSVALGGVFLAAAYAATGRLWLAIGLHTGWNFAEGSVFSTDVSGTDMGPGLIAGSLTGPDILTGGRFGPEGSIVVIAVVLAATVYLLWRVVKLGRAEPPIWGGKSPAAAP